MAFVNEQNDPLVFIERLDLALEFRNGEFEGPRDQLCASRDFAGGVRSPAFRRLGHVRCPTFNQFRPAKAGTPNFAFRFRLFPHVGRHFGSDGFLFQVNVLVLLHHAENQVRSLFAENALNDFDLRDILLQFFPGGPDVFSGQLHRPAKLPLERSAVADDDDFEGAQFRQRAQLLDEKRHREALA